MNNKSCGFPLCDGGSMDSGGVTPWGAPIIVACPICCPDMWSDPQPEPEKPIDWVSRYINGEISQGKLIAVFGLESCWSQTSDLIGATINVMNERMEKVTKACGVSSIELSEALKRYRSAFAGNMKTPEEIKPNHGPIYAAALYPDLCKIFQRHGYALAAHGSLARDFDLIAVPWNHTVSTIEEVLKDIKKEFAVEIAGEPVMRYHGRVAYTLVCGFGNCCIDLSFLPPIYSQNKTCIETDPEG